MKNILIIFMFLLCSVSANATENHQNYFSIKGAFLNLSDFGFDRDLKGTEIKFDSGYSLSGALGTKLNPFDFSYGEFRTDVEWGYGETPIFHMKSNYDLIPIEGDLRSKKIMANLYYDHKLKNGKLSPYVGGGLGWLWVEESGGLIDDNAFAYQLMAGITYKINSTISLIAGAKYLRSSKIRMDISLPQTGGILKSGEIHRSGREIPLEINGKTQMRYTHTDKSGPTGTPLPVTSYTNLESLDFEVGFQFAF